MNQLDNVTRQHVENVLSVLRPRTAEELQGMSTQGRADLVRLREVLLAEKPTMQYRAFGYRMLDASAVRRITTVADTLAQRDYHLTDGRIADGTLDRVATYIARRYNGDQVEEFLHSPRWQYGLVMLIANQLGRRAAGGGGSMARLPGDYERAVGTLYSPWLDSFGMSAPAIGNTARAVGIAPGIPERDSPSLARSTRWAETLQHVEHVELVLAALDQVYQTSRGTWRVPWRTVAQAFGISPRVARYRVRRALSPLAPPTRRTRRAKRTARPVPWARWNGAANAKRDLVVTIHHQPREWFTKRPPQPFAAEGIAPNPEPRTCCPAHEDVERANRMRAVIGLPPITTARCRQVAQY